MLTGLLGAAMSAAAAEPVSWEALNLSGKSLVLIDQHQEERYSLRKGGVVLATLGEVNGPMAAPVWYWQIKNRTLLIGESPGAQPHQALRLQRVDGDVVQVRRQSGARARFRLVASKP